MGGVSAQEERFIRKKLLNNIIKLMSLQEVLFTIKGISIFPLIINR